MRETGLWKWDCLALKQPRQNLVLFLASFLTAALTCQRFLYALLFTRLQVVGVTLNLLNNVFLLNLAFEATKGVF